MTLIDDAKKLLGKQVRVILDRDDYQLIGNGDFETSYTVENLNPKPVIAEGKFLAFGEMGEFVIEEKDGDIKYCWPMLEINEIPSAD